jgi:lipoyl synthase
LKVAVFMASEIDREHSVLERERRLPEWIKSPLRTDKDYRRVQRLLARMNLNTVCEDAKCPNRLECWNSGTATMMIMGEVCTRDCAFCAVATGRPADLDADEPERVAIAAEELNLRHLVLTSVTRDDLSDGGASIFADCIKAVRRRMPRTTIEVLIPDLKGERTSLATVFRAAPDVLNHNIETVRRLQARIRPQASYERSLAVLRAAADWPGGMAVKSGIMVGLGESDAELRETMQDLYDSGCRLLTIGQYLAPSSKHWPIERFVEPEIFERYAEQARATGFAAVAAAPMVRSSYHAAEMAAAVGGEVGDAGTDD